MSERKNDWTLSQRLETDENGGEVFVSEWRRNKELVLRSSKCVNGEYEDRLIAIPIEDWHEDYGDVLWWKFPIEEPPYVGSPLCEDWPGYHTHWTPIVVPEPPMED